MPLVALTHSPADVLARLLVEMGLAGDPDVEGAEWPARSEEEVAVPEGVITVFDTAGVDNGRDAFGDRTEHHGIQVRVRSGTFPSGWAKAEALAVALDGVHWDLVAVEGVTYLVHTVDRTGPVLRLGKERTSSRRLFTVNALISLTQLA